MQWFLVYLPAIIVCFNRRITVGPPTPLLRDLHWLKSPERVKYKLAVTDRLLRCFRCLAP